MDIRNQQVAPSSGGSEAENSTAVLQLLGVAKTLLANVRACRQQCALMCAVPAPAVFLEPVTIS